MSRDASPDPRPSKRRRLSPTPSESEDDPILANGDVESAGDGYKSEEIDADLEETQEEDGDDEAEAEPDHQEQADEAEDDGGVSLNGNGRIPKTAIKASKQLGQSPRAPQMPTPKHDKHPTTTSTNTLGAQIERLLVESTPDFGAIQSTLSDTLKKLKKAIESIPDTDPLPLERAEKRLLKSHKIAIPFPHPRPASDVKYKFAFSKPINVNVIGSFALKTAIKSKAGLTIDLVVNMPPDLFEVKDYLNHRYFYKRAYYLACIAAALKSLGKSIGQLRYGLLNGDGLLPVIVIEPRSEDVGTSQQAPYKIQIIPALSADPFPSDKTSPGRNCVRSSDVASTTEPQQLPTPTYNSVLRANCTVNDYLKLLHKASTRSSGFKDACRLGTTWTQQRGLGSSNSQGGFGTFEWSALMALLLETGGSKRQPLLSPSYSATQLFGATLHFLAQRDLVKNPLITDGQKMTSLDGVPLLFDSERSLNLMYRMTPTSYRTLRNEAQAASRVFGGSSSSKFETLFVTQVHQPLLKNDLILRFDLPEEAAYLQNEAARKLYAVLTRGLGDRVSQLSLASSVIDPWRLGTSRSDKETAYTLGISFDPATVPRSVDRGPSAEDVKGIASFRTFWGDKAEMRRFKDGEIRESLVWSTGDPRTVSKEIVSFLLARHFDLPTEAACTVISGSLSDLAVRSLTSESQGAREQTPSAYRTLETTIRGLEGLPLQVRQMQSSSSFTTDDQEPNDIILQFEGSNRWPADLAAVQMTKIAFLIRLVELLDQASVVDSATVGIENEHSDILDKTYADIALASTVFRLRIHHEREQPLIERRLGDKTLSPRSREEAALALAEFKRIFIRAPLHTQTMQKMTTQFPAFSPTIRLLKAWMNAQLLGNHFHPELIELLAGKVFLDPQPWSVPSSETPAFLRILHFLSRWDWHNDPLILDSSGELKKADIAAIRTKLDAWRQIDPMMNRVAMFVATSYDTDGITWTEHMPNKMVALRLSNLAKAASRLVEEKGTDLDINDLFKPNLSQYSFVLRLRRPRKDKESKHASKYKNLQLTKQDDPALAGFDPVALYLEELQRVYGDSALFFCDTINRELIAGLWSPHTVRRRWKVNLGWSTMPVQDAESEGQDGGTEVSINKEAMIAEMARLGGDLVRSVEMR